MGQVTDQLFFETDRMSFSKFYNSAFFCPVPEIIFWGTEVSDGLIVQIFHLKYIGEPDGASGGLYKTIHWNAFPLSIRMKQYHGAFICGKLFCNKCACCQWIEIITSR